MDTRFNSALEMRSAVFFDGENASAKYSRFWLLLVLAAVIASAGVIADSTATVIGAMIVAPLMTPIQGTMLATVLGDRANLIRSLLLVLAGAAAAVAVGYLVGSLVVADVLAATNPQVAGRVSPRLIDLLAALGTGVVGSIALVRKDISDTLPGVAIAISLVPPLTVAGLALESGSFSESLGALLLFVTNVVAILGTGIVVMSVYGVNRLSSQGDDATPRRVALRQPIVLLAIMLAIIGTPLALTSAQVATKSIVETAVYQDADAWATEAGWRIDSVISDQDRIEIRAEGPLPLPDTDTLKERLVASDIDVSLVRVTLVPVQTVDLGD